MGMGLVEFAAAKTLASSAAFVFITVLLMAAAKRTRTCIVLFGAQSAVIAAQVIAAAFMHRSVEAYIVGALLLGIKVIAIPYVLFRIVERLKTPRDVTASTSSSQSIFIVAGLILLSFLVVRPYVQELRVDEDMLAAAVALLLTGAFLMVSRKKALMQVIGLLVLENGIFLAALTTTFGMPLVIEIGIFFDLLMGVFLMGIFVFRIRDTFDHLDVSKLRRLRG
jgi:hydrogenase-4 component E